MKKVKIILTLLLTMSLFWIAPGASKSVSASSSHSFDVEGLNDKSEEIKLRGDEGVTVVFTFPNGKKFEKTLPKSKYWMNFATPSDMKPLLVYGKSIKIEYKQGNTIVKTETRTVKRGVISPRDMNYSNRDRVISGVGHPGKRVVLFTTVVTPSNNVRHLEEKVLKIDATGRWMYKYTDKESKEFNELTAFQVLSDSSSISGDEESSKSNPGAIAIKEGRVNPIAVGERYIAGTIAYSNMEGWTKSIEMSVTFPNGRTVKRAFESIPYKQRGNLNNEWSIEIPKDIVLKPQDKVKVQLFSDMLAKKSTDPIVVTVGGEAAKTPTVNYSAHVENIGWQTPVKDGALAGTSGKGLRVESFRMNLTNLPMSGGINYATHVQDIGWQDAVSNNEISGTTGKGLRMEAMKISLTGEMSKYYDVYYRTHVQNHGWLDWARNGEEAGTSGKGLRMEAIEVKLVKKGYPAPASNGGLARLNFISPPKVYYTAHVQNEGWQNTFGNGDLAGTMGKGLRVEALKMALYEHEPSSSISYAAHVENIGWQSPVTKWGTAGTVGRGLRIEAIRVNLTGALTKYYDVYYRTHVQNYGWLGWAKNGQNAGTGGKSLQMEAFEVKLVAKGDPAPETGASYV